MISRLIFIVMLCSLPAGVDLRAEEPEVKEQEMTELGEQMEQMSSAFRRLRRQAAEPAYNESSLELVAAMRQAADAALNLIPEKAAELPEAERAQFVCAYQERLKELITALGELKAHFQAADNPAAVRLIARLVELQKESHREFRRPKRD
jgi:soluble cytochrome b562